MDFALTEQQELIKKEVGALARTFPVAASPAGALYDPLPPTCTSPRRSSGAWNIRATSASETRASY